MAMELLGPNVEDLLNYCGRKLSLKTVIMLGDQMVRFIYRKLLDLKDRICAF